MGRSFSLMMSQNWFSKAANKIISPRLFLKLMDNFVTRCMMLPPPDPLSQPLYDKQSVELSCCRRRRTTMIPRGTLQRNQHQLHHRQRVLHHYNQSLMSHALQQEPTVDEIEQNTTKPFFHRISLVDGIVSTITALLCLGVILLLHGHSFESHVLESITV